MFERLRIASKAELTELERIFEENYVGNGGLLVTRGFCPSEENLKDILVYEVDSHVVGYVNKSHVIHRVPTKWYETHDDDLFIFINQIAIKASEQRKGYGSKIYNLISRAYPVVYAYVKEDNVLSASFHKKCGFDVVGVWEQENYQGVDNYIAYLYRYERREPIMEVGCQAG